MADFNNTELLQQFASDNYSGICPEAWAAMETANHDHAAAYGDDPWTARAADAFRNLFETDCEVFFAFNGTAANSLALASLCQSYHGVICSESAHVETDECGAPEFFSNGSKLFVAKSSDGKLSSDAIREIATKRQDIHYPKPRAATITQSTETGLVYTPDEHCALLHPPVRLTTSVCTWMERVSQMLARVSVVLPQSLAGNAELTCCASVGQKMVWLWEKPSSSLIGN